jgi:hypothetical protein
MVTELEALYTRLDKIRMTEADRHMARASLEQAEALADALMGAIALLRRVTRGRSARAPRSLGLQAQGPNSRA